MSSNTSWHKIADYIHDLDFGSNNIAVAEAGGRRVCIGRHGGEYFAFAYKCPHAGGVLAEGFINALGQVVCPLHRYRYDIKNGRNVSGEGYYLSHWPVELREDGVFVGMEVKKGLFGW